MSDIINEARVLDEFLELVQVRCSTRNEREIGDILTKRLTELGASSMRITLAKNSAVIAAIS
jgi:tripeptide aminopeptidase